MDNFKEQRFSRGSSILGSIFETAQVIAISLVVVLFVKYYLLQPFLVKGASMEPNFHDGNYLVIDEVSYRFEKPKRGDVIVFKYPRDPKQYFIKRIVGLPNEKVEIKGSTVKIYNEEFPNGQLLDEKYLPDGTVTKGNLTVQLEEKEYFVLGDNRSFSSDSRYWGTVSSDLVVGKVWFEIWIIEKVVDSVKTILN